MRPYRWTIPLAVALAASVLLPGSGQGQTVLGRAVAAETGAPIAGVFVTLTDSTGIQLAGSLSRADGGFLIRTPAAGRYVLRAEMIGYVGLTQDVELAPGETLRKTLAMPLHAIELDRIVARSSRRRACRLGAEEGDALTRLWSEARKALRIADWAEDTGWLRANGYTYQRVLDLVDLEVLAETVEPVRSLDRHAFAAADPATVRSEGFIRGGDGEAVLYRGADARMLLSDAFADTHCFRIAAREEDGLVGVGFEPRPARDLPEIEGVLWLDAETARLERLEYRYTSYPVTYPVPESRYGGRTEFRHLPGGGVAVQRWRIRMPSLRHWADEPGLRGARRCGTNACDDGEALRTLSRAGLAIREAGGEVLEFRLADGTLLPATERAAIAGSVMDSTAPGSPGPLTGAEVVLVGTAHRTITDAHGRFRFDGLPEGGYRLRFQHPRLPELGIERPASVMVSAARGEVASAALATPSPRTLAVAACDGRTPVVYGLVRDANTGAAIAGASVRILPADTTDIRERTGDADGDGITATNAGSVAETETDPTGRYRFCETPVEPLFVSAEYLGIGREAAQAEPTADGAARVDFDLVLSRSARLLGHVVRIDDESAVQGALVRIGETGQTSITDTTGRFSFDSIPPGAFTVAVEHIAYRPSEGFVAVRGGEVVEVRLAVSEQVFDMEPLVVTARSRPLLQNERMGGFHIRQARGLGTFIGRGSLEGRSGARVTDLLREAPGIEVIHTGTARILRGRTASPGFPAGTTNPFCSPMIYLDGTKITTRTLEEPDLEDAVRIIDAIPLSQIAGIEIYAGAASVPGAFAGLDTNCGVVAVWTRGRDRTPR